MTGPAVTAAANVDLVRHFYAAVAAVLATGDVALLDSSVSPDLIEHPARPGAASGRDGFVRALLALRATFPGLTLVVDDVRAAGEDQVLARVHTEGAESGVFLGRPVPASFGEWGPLEVWRIADGQLVERWGGLDSRGAVANGSGAHLYRRTRSWTPEVDRDAGHRRAGSDVAGRQRSGDSCFRGRAWEADRRCWGALGGSAIAVAAGTATPPSARPARHLPRSAGDRIVTASEADYTLRNAGPIPVIALVVIVSNTLDGDWPLNSSSAAASWTVAAMPEALGGVLPSPAGFSARVLAADVEVELPEQPTLALGWMFLTPGATLALPAGDNTMVNAVDEGWAGLTATNGAGGDATGIRGLDDGPGWSGNPVASRG